MGGDGFTHEDPIPIPTFPLKGKGKTSHNQAFTTEEPQPCSR